MTPKHLPTILALVILAGIASATGAGRVAAQSADSSHHPSDFAQGTTLRAAFAAPPPGLTMQATGGYDGHYKIGEWFPIRVDLSNTGPQQISGQLEVHAENTDGTFSTTYVRDVELPSPSRKQLTLYTYASTYGRSFTVVLTRGGAVLLDQQVRLDPVEYPAFLLGVVSDDAGALNALKDEDLGRIGPSSGSVSPQGSTRATVAHLAPADLPPSAAALDGLDALVLAGTNTANLPTEVHDALAGWVLRGGTLVVCGGAGVQGTAAGVGDLLPVAVTGSRAATDFTALSAWAGVADPPQATAPALVSTGAPLDERGATILVDDTGGPLVVARPYGAGQVIYLALDPSLPPLRDWSGTARLWRQLLRTTTVDLSLAGVRRLGNQYGYMYYDSFGGSPFEIPGIQLPSAWLVGGFLLVYLLLLGPVNYLVLRALKRVELAWVTIPALIVVFVIGSYTLGVASKGNALRLVEASVVRTYSAAPLASVDSFIGLLSPTRQSYDLTFGGDVPLTELNPSGWGFNAGVPATIAQGRPTQVRNLQVDTWALRGFLAESTVTYANPFTATLVYDNGRLVGRLTNRGPAPLRDVGVIWGGAAQRVGDLGPGAGADVSLALQGQDRDHLIGTLLPGAGSYSYSYSYSSQNNADARALARRASLLSTALNTLALGPNDQPPLIVAGWGGAAPLDPQVPGHAMSRDEVTLVLGDLPVPPGAPAPPPLPNGGSGPVYPFVVTTAAPMPVATAPPIPTTQPPSLLTPSPSAGTRMILTGAMLPPPLDTWQVVSGMVESDSLRGLVLVNNEPVILQHIQQTNAAPTSLVLVATLIAGAAPVSADMEILNWHTGVYEPAGGMVADSQTGPVGARLPIDQPAEHIGPQGQIYVRIAPWDNRIGAVPGELRVEETLAQGIVTSVPNSAPSATPAP